MLLRYRFEPSYRDNGGETVWRNGFLVGRWVALLFLYDTPSVFRYAVASEVFATRQRKCFYAIAGTACWDRDFLAGDNASTLSQGRSRGRLLEKEILVKEGDWSFVGDSCLPIFGATGQLSR